jgi:tryptophanyl-tRNA synthetase
LDTNEWRRELDRLSEMKGMLVTLNQSLEEQTNHQIRQLYDVFANLTKADNELGTAGFMAKRKLQSQLEKINGELEDQFMRIVRDFAELFRREHRDIIGLAAKLQEMKPAETKVITSMSFPSVGAGDFTDFQRLYEFADAFSKKCGTLKADLSREVKDLLDENKRTVETFERHITIDRGEVATTVSNETISGLSVTDLILMNDKLKAEKVYLDGRRGEVGKMLGVSLMSDIESLQAWVDTSVRLGLELPMDFSQKLRVLAREASGAENLTTLISLESQMHASRLQVANLLKDRIINMKHELTTKFVEAGIPTTSDIIPQAPSLVVENQEVPSLLSSYQKMVEWEGQVKITLKDKVEELLDDIEKAAESPEDTGITDVASARDFVANSNKQLKNAELDVMISIYQKAFNMDEEHKKYVKDMIKSYLARFNELATSADRVLDYAQLSKKAPKLEELEGSIVFLLQSLENLRGAVESGVATFRDACHQEIEAIIQDLQTIKPAYAEMFMPIITDLDEGEARIKEMNEFAEIRSEMRTIKETILAKAKESLENLRYRLGVKIRLAAAKLMGAGVEIPPEVQDGISELNSIGVAAETVFSLPQLARKMIEVYEKKITGKVLESLNKEATALQESFSKAASIGVPLNAELATLMNIIDSPPSELEDAADAFDRLAALTTSKEIQERVRERGNDAYRQINGAISIFEEQGMPDFVKRLKSLIEQVPQRMQQESKYITEPLEVCLTLANVQSEMLGMIKNIASKDKETHDKEIRKQSKYYSTIERVYEKHPDEFSKLIFPLNKVAKLETDLDNAEQLDKALEYFNELKEMRSEWVEKAEKMDDWHKSMKMFLTGYSPTASQDERLKFLDDAIRKIRETYSREDISSYLSWAIREIAQTMTK